MRAALNPKVEKYRRRVGPLASNSTYGNNGAYTIPHPSGATLIVIASDGEGWDHVSAHTIDAAGVSRIPTWQEMSYLKELFFEDTEVVMQLHVAKKNHLNLHPHVLHLWRPQNKVIPLPPPQMVAPTNVSEWQKILQGERILGPEGEKTK